MKITFLGHASLQIEWNGTHFVVDPFISPNEKAGHIDIDALQADYLLITHGHQDHVADAERIAKNTGAKVVSNFEIVSWFGEKDIEGHPMNHGGKWKFGDITVKYVHAIHSSVLPDGTYGGNPGGFVMWDDKQCLYIAGDTALTMDMKLLPQTCPEINLAVLPIGDNFTMDYKDAIIASDYIECDQVLGYHYDTFGYIEIDHEAAKKAFDEKGKVLHLLPIGESIEI